MSVPCKRQAIGQAETLKSIERHYRHGKKNLPCGKAEAMGLNFWGEGGNLLQGQNPENDSVRLGA
jgi:hypothetical protein